MSISLKPENLKRYKDIANLFWKYGRGDLVKSSGLEKIFEEEENPYLPQHEATKPEELASDLEKMGPIYIKLGQLLSTRNDILPQEYIAALEKLQNELPPFSFAEVESIVQEELGIRISKAFLEFESVPIASASLGQVHRAILRDGRPVVVKVQRPGIRKQIGEDLDALEDIATFLDDHTDSGRKTHYKEILAGFRTDLAHELDYIHEAKNLTIIGENLQSFTKIIVPAPVTDYTTSKVLTMDYIRGKKVTAIGPLMKLELDGSDLAEELFKAYLKQILIDGIFHADPHPGNIFVTEDKRIALIDLGMTGHVSDGMQEKLLKLLLAVSEGDAEGAGTILMEIGTPLDDFDEYEFRRKLTATIADEQGATLDEIQIGRSMLTYKRFASESGLEMPAELTMVSKTLLNLDLVGRTLDPVFEPNEAIRRNAADITKQRFMKSLSPGNIFSALIETKEFIRQMPGRINHILDALAKNQFKVKIDYGEEATFIEGFQKVANRIATGLILAALIVGASLLMRVETSFKLFGYPGLAIILFLLAAGGGCWLLIRIMMNDRSIKK